MLVIIHDCGVIAQSVDGEEVMYAGGNVETGPVRELFQDPRHPYTRGLLGSIPGGLRGKRLQAIPGTVPAIGHLPPGCAFAPRCADRFEPCGKAVPGVTVIDVRRPTSEVRRPRSDVPDPEEPAGVWRRASDLDAAHTARCYLYSPAVDPDVLPEQTR